MNTQNLKLTKVKKIVEYQVPINYYLVSFETIWGSYCNSGEHDDCLDHGCLDNEPSYIAEIIPSVVKITKNNFNNLDYERAMKIDKYNEYDDTHDIRPRLFKTRSEALEHVKYTVDKFNNPSPWQVFVKEK